MACKKNDFFVNKGTLFYKHICIPRKIRRSKTMKKSNQFHEFASIRTINWTRPTYLLFSTLANIFIPFTCNRSTIRCAAWKVPSIVDYGVGSQKVNFTDMPMYHRNHFIWTNPNCFISLGFVLKVWYKSIKKFDPPPFLPAMTIFLKSTLMAKSIV